MKIVFSLSMVLFFNCILSQTNNQGPKSIHDFNVQDIYGNDFDFNSLTVSYTHLTLPTTVDV